MPDNTQRIIIVGAGLAGACAALWLSQKYAVTVLEEAPCPATGASGAAAGLVNPLMGHKANPVWRLENTLSALHATLEEAGANALFLHGGVLRPARDARQARSFQDAARQHTAHALWLDVKTVREQWPAVTAPHGAMHVTSGGAISVPAFVQALLGAAAQRGAEIRYGVRVTGWREEIAGVSVASSAGTSQAGRLLLCPGDGFRDFPLLGDQPIHRIKGQTIRVRRPTGLGIFPCLSGFGYVVPEENTLVIGSSYEHEFEDVRPSEEVSAQLLAQAAKMLPGIASAEVLEEMAGVRVTVPGARLPLVGPLSSRVWGFTALGSKGLLMAPMLARELPGYFDAPDRIPPEVRVR